MAWLISQTDKWGGSCIATTKDEAPRGEQATKGICKRDNNVQSRARTLWLTHFSLNYMAVQLKHPLSDCGDAMGADWLGVDPGCVDCLLGLIHETFGRTDLMLTWAYVKSAPPCPRR